MKKIIFIPFLLLAVLTANAQVEPELPKESKEQPKVIIYSAEEPQKKASKESGNLFKINLISALTGDVGVAFERKLGNNISAEGGLGVTVRNFSQGMLINFFEIDEGSNDARIEREYKLGPSFMAAFKYYPTGAIDEFYFAPEIRFRRYNSEARVTNQRGNYAENVTLTDFKITVGYVNFIEDKIFLEYNAGVGIRSRNQNLLTFRKNDSVTGTPLNIYEIENLNVFAPLLSFGLKIGFVASK